MRDGDSWWRRLNPCESPSRSDRESRQPRQFRPDAVSTAALEDRKLLSTTAAAVTKPGKPAATDLKGFNTLQTPAVIHTSQAITTGPDGNLWFTEPGVGKIGKTTPGGAVTEYQLPAGHQANEGITAGPDGNVWFTETGYVGRVTPSGVVTEFAVSPGAQLTGITKGGDGNLWFLDTADRKIGKITTSGVVTEYPIPASSSPKSGQLVNFYNDITLGSDGNVWYTANVVSKAKNVVVGEVGRVTPSGQVTIFKLPAGAPPSHSFSLSKSTQTTGGISADSITSGPDGNLWVTDHRPGGQAAIARITPTGEIKQFAIPTTPTGAKLPDISTSITTGPDGNLWFNLVNDNYNAGPNPTPFIGRITPEGKATIFTIPYSTDTQGALMAEGAESITAGPLGQVWFTSGSRRYVSATGNVIATFPHQERGL